MTWLFPLPFAQEREMHQELWRLEDESTLLTKKSECWRRAEATTTRKVSEGKERMRMENREEGKGRDGRRG